MQTFNKTYHKNVQIYEFGYAPLFLKPYITVFCYFIDGLLIDTAQRNCEKLVLKHLPISEIKQIALTHWHEDHTGNCAILQEKTQAHTPHICTYAHTYTQEKVKSSFPVLPYEEFLFGKIKPAKGVFAPFPEKIITPKHIIYPIFADGHSIDHTVFLEKNEGWLFSGDLFVNTKIKFFRKGEDIYQTIKTLKKVEKEDFDTIFCGHNPQISDGKAIFNKKIQYLEDFVGQVQQNLQKGVIKPTQIIKNMQLQERTLLKLLTFNDVSLAHMVKSAMIYDV